MSRKFRQVTERLIRERRATLLARERRGVVLLAVPRSGLIGAYWPPGSSRMMTLRRVSAAAATRSAHCSTRAAKSSCPHVRPARGISSTTRKHGPHAWAVSTEDRSRPWLGQTAAADEGATSLGQRLRRRRRGALSAWWRDIRAVSLLSTSERSSSLSSRRSMASFHNLSAAIASASADRPTN